MLIFLLLGIQATTLPDIELRATVRARSLTIEKAGRASVEVTGGGQDIVAVEGPEANGRKRINNPVFTVRIEGRIADPQRPEQTDAPGPNGQ
jgi:hypothetical protein